MNTCRINNDIDVSRIVLGTDYYGKTIPEDIAFSLLDCYISYGGNAIDTAHVYSDYLPGERHMGEKTIGKWLKSRNLRSRIVVSTKGGFPHLENYHISRLSRSEIRKDITGSLRCLGTDFIDLYWLHRDDETVEPGEFIEILNEFRSEGIIRCFGASNFRAERIAEANRYAEIHGKEKFCASQIKWGLAITSPGAEYDDTIQEMNESHYRFHCETKLPLFAYSSQAKGFFSKLHIDDNGEAFMEQGKCRDRYFCRENIEIYRRLLEKAKESGKSVAELALRSLLDSEFPVHCIVGCRSTEQLEATLAADM